MLETARVRLRRPGEPDTEGLAASKLFGNRASSAHDPRLAPGGAHSQGQVLKKLAPEPNDSFCEGFSDAQAYCAVRTAAGVREPVTETDIRANAIRRSLPTQSRRDDEAPRARPLQRSPSHRCPFVRCPLRAIAASISRGRPPILDSRAGRRCGCVLLREIGVSCATGSSRHREQRYRAITRWPVITDLFEIRAPVGGGNKRLVHDSCSSGTPYCPRRLT